ncbi:MAG: DUF465 domain-containing protein [Alphaproteobacteria bacterium]|nr:DUF465 domain-containing protein [Alphaproteobacteria bacterium]
MAIEARIRELDARHHRLDDQIDEEVKHPSSDSLRLHSLKKEKLKLKDEIQALKRKH